MKQCMNCLQWKDESEFDWRYRAFIILRAVCRECSNRHRNNKCQRNRRQELEVTGAEKHTVAGEAREYVYNYLSTHPCVACGKSDPEILEFHYIECKGWIGSNLAGGGNDLATLQTEIAKCVVLCANCYRRILDDELGLFKGKKVLA